MFIIFYFGICRKIRAEFIDGCWYWTDNNLTEGSMLHGKFQQNNKKPIKPPPTSIKMLTK